MSRESGWIQSKKSLVVLLIALGISMGVGVLWHATGLDETQSTDYLAFFGALIGALATIMAVVCEIHADAEARKRDYELATQPIIWCGIEECVEPKAAGCLLPNVSEAIKEQQDQARQDYKDDVSAKRYVIILSKEAGEYKRGYSAVIGEKLSLKIHNSTYLVEEAGGIGEAVSDYTSLFFVMKNVGVGPALSLREGTQFENESEGRCCRVPRILGAGDEFRFVVCLDRNSNWDDGDWFYVTASYLTVTGRSMRYSLKVLLDVDTASSIVKTKIARQGQVTDCVFC